MILFFVLGLQTTELKGINVVSERYYEENLRSDFDQMSARFVNKHVPREIRATLGSLSFLTNSIFTHKVMIEFKF